MKSQKSFLLALLLSLILSSFIFTNEIPLWGNISSVLPITSALIQEKPEYQVSVFHSKQFNQQGLLSSTLSAESLSFFSTKQRSFLQKPEIELYPKTPSNDKNLPSWLVKSNTANSEAPNNLVLLNDQVELTQLNAPSPLIIHAQEMELLLNEKIAKSKSLVTIVSTQNEIKGEDFESHLEESYLELKSKVSSQYQAAEKSTGSHKAKQPLFVNAGFFKLENQGTKATYTDHVELKQDNIKITADKVEIIKLGDKQLAYAYGNPAYFEQKPTLEKKNILAQAERFEFDSQEQKLKLFINAKLQQGDAIVEGDYLYYDTQNENVGAESNSNSRVKMTIPTKTNN